MSVTKPTIVAFITLCILILVAMPVFAQTPTPGPVATVTPAPLGASGHDLSASQIWGSVVIPLVFALIAVWLILRFVARSEDKYYEAVAALAKQGRPATVSYTGAFSVPLAPSAREGVTVEPAPPKHLKIEGPGVVVAGEESAEFIATSDGELVEADWSVDPPGGAAIIPNSTEQSKVRVVATRPAKFMLSATASYGSIRPARVQIEAIPSKAATTTLPFIGQGYGTLVIAIVAVAVVLSLALNGVLGGEAVATFFGGLLGYIFGVGTTSAVAAKTATPSTGQTPQGDTAQ